MARTDALQAKTIRRKQAIIQRSRMTEETLQSANEENFKRLNHSGSNGNLEEQGTYGSHCLG